MKHTFLPTRKASNRFGGAKTLKAFVIDDLYQARAIILAANKAEAREFAERSGNFDMDHKVQITEVTDPGLILVDIHAYVETHEDLEN
jgi:hypothetical protein